MRSGTELTMRPYSHERRRATRWNRAACRPKSLRACKKSSSALPATNSTPLPPRDAIIGFYFKRSVVASGRWKGRGVHGVKDWDYMSIEIPLGIRHVGYGYLKNEFD